MTVFLPNDIAPITISPMSLSSRLVVCGLLAIASGCAPRLALVPGSAEPVPQAREPFRSGLADSVWTQAVRVLEQQGYGFDACDDGHAALRTRAIELDAPCGESTCLARQFVTVKVGWRAVRLAVRREVWDPTWRGWRPVTDMASLLEMARLEQDLMDQLMEKAEARAWPPLQAGATCPAPAPCRPGQCDLVMVAARYTLTPDSTGTSQAP
jgi:hypothetical protein